MNSPNILNYDIRPAKFAERKMLLASLLNICKKYGPGHQYIGFGGVSFTDFKLFHKELHIDEMFSIEGGESISKERVTFNCPYSFIKLKFGLSTSQLLDIDLSKKSIIWLDYDDDLSDFMFEDLEILFRRLPVGSVYIMTCNRQLKDKEKGSPYDKDTFKQRFGDYVPFELKNKDLNGENNFKTIRSMLLNLIISVLNDRSRGEENLSFFQLYNFLYQERGGAKMYTFGGIIESQGFDINDLNLSNFDFVKLNEEPYRLNVPLLTLKEIDYINRNLGNHLGILHAGVIETNEYKKYLKTYKYLPNYLDVRL